MNTDTKLINWVLYHKPADLFLRTANAFANEIKQATDGKVQINIQTLEEYCDEHHDGKHVDPISLMKNGEVHMSQTQVWSVGVWGAEDFFALEMPYLFKDHDHATRVLEGPIGERLLSSLPESTPVRGLSFTYSGGYRVIASRKPINTANELEGLHMAVVNHAVFTDTAKAFGCNYTSLTEYNEIDQFGKEYSHNEEAYKKSDLMQTTAIRYKEEIESSEMPYVINSQHSMYLTTILISEKFWQSLTNEEQELFKSCAIKASRLERNWSVQDGNEILSSADMQKTLGIKQVISFDSEEGEKLKSKVSSVYQKYDQLFSKGLLEEIKQA